MKRKAKMPKIEPCVCRTDTAALEGANGYFVTCADWNCRAKTGPISKTKRGAINAWNAKQRRPK